MNRLLRDKHLIAVHAAQGWARYERRSRHQRYDRMGLACSVGEGRTGASRISGLCANFHPCRVSPQPRSALFPAFLAGVVLSRRRIWTSLRAAFGARWSTRCLGIGWIAPASLSSAVWLRRLRSQSGKRLGYACCGPRSRMVERRPPPLLPSTVCRPRTLLTCSFSCVLRRGPSCDRAQPAHRWSRLRTLDLGT